MLLPCFESWLETRSQGIKEGDSFNLAYGFAIKVCMLDFPLAVRVLPILPYIFMMMTIHAVARCVL